MKPQWKWKEALLFSFNKLPSVSNQSSSQHEPCLMPAWPRRHHWNYWPHAPHLQRKQIRTKEGGSYLWAQLVAEQKVKLKGLPAQFCSQWSIWPLGPALNQNSNHHNEISVQWMSINASLLWPHNGLDSCERHRKKDRSQSLPSKRSFQRQKSCISEGVNEECLLMSIDFLFRVMKIFWKEIVLTIVRLC